MLLFNLSDVYTILVYAKLQQEARSQLYSFSAKTPNTYKFLNQFKTLIVPKNISIKNWSITSCTLQPLNSSASFDYISSSSIFTK